MKQLWHNLMRPEAWIMYYFAFLVGAVMIEQRMGINPTDGGDPIIVAVVVTAIVLFLVYKLLQALRNRMKATGDIRTQLAGAFGMDQNFNRFLHSGEQEDVVYLPQYATTSSTRYVEREAVREVETEPLAQVIPTLPAPPRRKATLDLAEGLTPDITAFFGQNVFFTGDRRSGKSTGMARLAEQRARWLEPTVWFDSEGVDAALADPTFFPRGVLAGSSRIREQYPQMRTMVISAESAPSFGELIVSEGLQAVIDLSSFIDLGDPSLREAAQVIIGIIKGVNTWEHRQSEDRRVPCTIYLDEGHIWLPQNVAQSDLRQEDKLAFDQLQKVFFSTLVRLGGKWGLSLVLATQRVAEIDKQALQSYWKFIFRQTEHNDVKRVESLGINGDEVQSLPQGECFVMGPGYRCYRTHWHNRQSPHGGDTPGIENLFQHQKRYRNVTSIISAFEAPRPVQKSAPLPPVQEQRERTPVPVTTLLEEEQPAVEKKTTTYLTEQVFFDTPVPTPVAMQQPGAPVVKKPITGPINNRQRQLVLGDKTVNVADAIKAYNAGYRTIRPLGARMGLTDSRGIVKFHQAKKLMDYLVDNKLVV